MNLAGKLTAWICIASILLSGCYTSTLIDLNGAERQKVHPPNIEYVVMKSGVQYHFATPPAVLADAVLLKQATGATDTLCASGISHVITQSGVKQTFEGQTPNSWLLAEPISYVIMKDGTVYIFERPAAIFNGRVHGSLKAIAASGCANDPTAWKQAARGTMVALPLADVAQAYVSQYNPGLTFWVVAGVVVSLIVVTAATWKGPLAGMKLGGR